MVRAMASIEIRKSTAPAEAEDKAELEPFAFGDQNVQIATYRPGWRWSVDVKPIVQTETCQYEHLAFVHSGTMHVTHTDGSEADVVAGDIVHMQPGHDAWVVGDEPAIWFHVLGATPKS